MPSKSDVDLPSREELKKVPHRAVVAYTVRCARRVQPLCLRSWPKDDQRRRQLLDHVNTALNLATDCARGLKVSGDSLSTARDAVADAAPHPAHDAHDTAVGYFVAFAAVNAANAANADNADTAAVAARDGANYAAEVASRAAGRAAGAGAARKAFRRSARRDCELLLERFDQKPGDVRRRVTPSERGFLGDYWHGEPPEWYTELKPQLDRALRESRKSNVDTAVRRQPPEKEAEIEGLGASVDEPRYRITQADERVSDLTAELEAERKGLQAELQKKTDQLESARTDFAQAMAEHGNLQTLLNAAEGAKKLFEREAEEAKQRLEHSRAQLDELSQALLVAQKARDEEQIRRQESERELGRVQGRLDLEQAQPFSWYWQSLRKPSTIFSFIALALLVVISGMVLFGIGELRERQQLELFLMTQIAGLREDLADRTPGTTPDGDADKERLDEFQKHHGRLQTLTVSGTAQESETLGDIREDVFGLLVNGSAAAPPAAQPATSNTRVNVFWRCCMPRYMPSDLLLSLVVTISGTVGAIVTVIRANERVTPTNLAFGVAAGFITLLAIRGGKSVFLIQSEEVSFYLNPYSSAFLGLIAGLFTERAFQLLRRFVERLAAGLEETFGLDKVDGSDAAPGTASPARAETLSVQSEPASSPSPQPADDEPVAGEAPPDEGG